LTTKPRKEQFATTGGSTGDTIEIDAGGDFIFTPNNSAIQTLAETLGAGNTTDGSNIDVTSGDAVVGSSGFLDLNVLTGGSGPAVRLQEDGIGFITLESASTNETGTGAAIVFQDGFGPFEMRAAEIVGAGARFAIRGQGSTGGNGGAIDLRAGSTSAVATGGEVNITAGNTAAGGTAGNVLIASGTELGIGANGIITFNAESHIFQQIDQETLTITRQTSPSNSGLVEFAINRDFTFRFADVADAGEAKGFSINVEGHEGRDTTGTGGDVSVIAGLGGATSGAGGDLTLGAGDSQTSGDGGDVFITGGDAATSGAGGNINLNVGSGAGAGVNGTIFITGDVDITGKLTVSDLIDPTGLVLTQATAPATGASEGAIFISDGSAGLIADTLYYVGASDATPVIIGGAGATADTLAAVLAIGNTTDGTDISVSNGDAIVAEDGYLDLNVLSTGVNPPLIRFQEDGYNFLTFNPEGSVEVTFAGDKGNIIFSMEDGISTPNDIQILGQTLSSGVGGTVTLTGGNGTIGGAINVNSGSPLSNGAGGAINITTANGIGGGASGGPVVITTGTGSSTGPGGDIDITAGDGGASSGNGGDITVFAGGGQTNAGDVALLGGDVASGGFGGNITAIGGTNADGGNLEGFGGSSGTGGSGGAIVLITGSGNGAGAGGAFTITASGGGATGNGGAVGITAGNAGVSSGDGGDINIAAGTAVTNAGTITVSAGDTPSGGGGGTLSVDGAVSNAGGGLALTAGSGGTAGAGGPISIVSGTGSLSGVGGDIDITSGNGSTASAGDITVTGGNSTDDSGGGTIVLIAGDSGSGFGSSVTAGAAAGGGGGVDIFAGGSSANDSIGGNINLIAGSGNGSGNGGPIVITAGLSGTTGAGGTVAINGGIATSSGQFSGSVSLVAGSHISAGVGGQIIASGSIGDTGGATSVISGAGAGAAGDGGDLTITSGAGSGTGAGGNIDMTAGDGGFAGGGAVTITAGTSAGGGGDITLLGGDTPSGGFGSSITAASSPGGDGGGNVDMSAGNAANNGTGGTAVVSSGNGSGSGAGGATTISSGTGGTTGNGAALTLAAGNAGASGTDGGDVSISAGTSSTNGGGITLTTGTGSNPGTIDFVVGATTELQIDTGLVDAQDNEIRTTGFIAVGAAPATTTGALRLTNNEFVYQKDVGGTDTQIIGLNSSDQIVLGEDTHVNRIDCRAAVDHQFRIGGTLELHITTDVANFQNSEIRTTGFIAVGVDPAELGVIRIPNNSTGIRGRNAADNGQYILLNIDSNNDIVIGQSTGVQDIQLNCATQQRFQIGGTNELTISSGLIDALNNEISTTGSLSLGPDPAENGTLRLGNTSTVRWRNGANDGDILALRMQSDDDFWVGDDSAVDNLEVRCATEHQFYVGGNLQLQLNSSGMFLNDTLISWTSGVASPTIQQNTQTGAGATGNPFTISAQDVTGASSPTGGSMTLRAGNATGVGTGGELLLRSGDGNTAGRVDIALGTGLNVIESSATGTIEIGSNSGRNINLRSDTGFGTTILVNGLTQHQFTSAGYFLTNGDFFFGSGNANPIIQQSTVTDDDGVTMNIHSQDTSFAGATGGNLDIRAGNGGSNGDGGDLVLRAGSGAGTGIDGYLDYHGIEHSWFINDVEELSLTDTEIDILDKNIIDTNHLVYKTLDNHGNFGSSDTIDWNNNAIHTGTLDQASCTLTFTDPPGNVGQLFLALTQGSGGSKTVTWPTSIFWPNNTEPTLSTSEFQTDTFVFAYFGSIYFAYGQILNGG